MSRRAAFLIAGLVTALVMTVAIGLAGAASWFGRLAPGGGTAAAVTADTICVDPTEWAALQAQLQADQVALRQANTRLQAAYDVIAGLQRQEGYWNGDDADEGRGGYFTEIEAD